MIDLSGAIDTLPSDEPCLSENRSGSGLQGASPYWLVIEATRYDALPLDDRAVEWHAHLRN